MRLVVFGSGHPFRGGVARTTTELVQALESRGHELLFLTPRRQYPQWLFPGASDRDPDACRKLECAEPVLDPMNPFSWRGSRRRAVAFGADAWIIPYWTWAWAGWWRYLLHGRRPPVVGVAHNPADHDAGPLRKFAARGVLARCEAIFTHAQILESGLAKEYPGVPTASHPLPPTAVGRLPERAVARAELDLPLDRRVALFMGLIRPYKGVDLLIDAIAMQTPESDWILLVAGEPWGELGTAVSEQVRRLGFEKRVHLMLQWVPEGKVPQLLAAADLVVLPYRSGSQSAVAPMALAAGVPVLSTEVGGLPEIVQHGVNGYLVAPGSADELVRALAQLDGPLLARLAAGAHDGRDRFTWDGYAEELEGLVRQIVQEGN